MVRSRAAHAAALAAAMVLAAAMGTTLTACAPVVVAAGVGAGVMVATDRRSTAAQVDDESIEITIATEADRRWSGAHLNATSYNGIVLLTGEAPSTTVQDEISASVKGQEHVRMVQNEMTVGEPVDMKSRTNDTYLTGVVKSRLAESSPALAKHVKVVTERSVVYLMGLVTTDEGSSAGHIAASTSGVARVVKVFEYTN
jgi:osmotically-inducible protein OsmY